MGAECLVSRPERGLSHTHQRRDGFPLHLRRTSRSGAKLCAAERSSIIDDWVAGLREGRNYASDGKSHLIDFRVNGVEMGSGKDVELPRRRNGESDS